MKIFSMTDFLMVRGHPIGRGCPMFRGFLVEVPPGWNAGGDALLRQQGMDLVAVIPLVPHQGS
ncbi:MAG: hypothetical protein TE42_06010 [Candidatus Synechococcus spongiarum SP3]|uniref:Uncharacterized protein n=1 Tax=Candidatus Synechococcus spongiarum SP3 TaxID=1604020 RepID=A0A0G2J4R6_9SYNE|nr:MAG: hypothetical protein TE42_06010 [Candidatus Synechococcus spongiarum SP3]